MVVKFGLGLLRIPHPLTLSIPIISYHHGDPSAYRGRPAGFYEMLKKEPFLGQIVQVLANRLDAGEVLAFAQTRVVQHSYRQTLIDSFRMSPLLLGKALQAVANGNRVNLQPNGKLFRLPSDIIVLVLATKMFMRAIGRVAYGAFIEKRWRVSMVDHAGGACPTEAIEQAAKRSQQWESPHVRPPHRFHADPFFFGEDILVEAMNGRTGKGELLRLRGDSRASCSGCAATARSRSADCLVTSPTLPRLKKTVGATLFQRLRAGRARQSTN
ncbi:MAG TPA: hypothetical protein VNI79_01130 [Sphingomicrobium sp.]|nr:hypothetical protein [Sphingomicrobium sp.]